jgi:hypothetical protein
MNYLTTLLLSLYSWEFVHELYLVIFLKEFVLECVHVSAEQIYTFRCIGNDIVNMHC